MTSPSASLITPSSASTSESLPPEQSLRVLIADKFEASGIEALKHLGCDVQCDADLGPETLPGALSRINPDVLIVRSTKVNAEAISAGRDLSLILRAGAGYDTIDVATASARGVFVANCPGKNSIAVAELVWALILSCDRRVPDQTAELRAGTWNKKEYSKAPGIYGKSLGIVGLGQIGIEVARRAAAFGMKVSAWSRSLTQERADELDVGYVGKLVNIAKMSDVISVNVAATDETHHLIGEQFFHAMKPGAYFINTSRGSVVDQDAMTAAIREKGIRVGLDVFANEPSGGTGAFTDPIVKEPCVYGTHHVGASTDQAQNAIAAEAVRIVATYMKSGEVPNCVNRAASTPATILLTVRHLNRPGVLAHVFYTLGQAGINVEEMENVIYDGARAACARIQLDDMPRPEHLTAINANENVLSVTLSRIRK
ncbi:MAG TPA: 3-phosphoglycerate dehydrogenase family protein [Phycisphaerales bacterium]|nr:3-phosphoglycerate dehydrogenase family protein [Phycisphaerales bacterium]HRQ76111.1 3-phosphoglycerate dehydrogenase family protein [Phycisphaerales bacterium]